MQKGDVIYRQQAIDALDKRFDSIPMEQTTEILMLRKDLRELPSAQQQRILYANMSDAEFEKWLYEHGICNPNIHESIPCDAVPLLIDNAISELPSAQPEKTCCGYDEKELIAFAIACRRNEVDEKDLKTFAQDCEFAWQVMQEEFESKIREAFEKWTGGKSDAD